MSFVVARASSALATTWPARDRLTCAPGFSPDSKRIAFTDQTLALFYVDVDTKRVTKVDNAEYEAMDLGIDAKPIYDHAWSPDGRFLAYTKMGADLVNRVFVHSLETKEARPVTAGPLEGQVFHLGSDTAVSIGRAPSNDIPLPDTSVSSEHCRVRPEGGIFVIHDLKSTNGTFVNDRRVNRHPLVEGDVVRVGETTFVFRTDQA